jgi:cyclic beta-1,2-glucan synthetase
VKEWAFVIGQGRDRDQARALARRYRDPAQVRTALEAVTKHWDGILEAVQVRTPDPAFNMLLNRWLLYQALACRVWARSAFYQSGGAYGFRDQLQDVMAMVYARPDLAREHILCAASRQFAEGDVQHWWHPTSGQGVRNRFSDDYLWLPYVAHHYVQVTGDTESLDQAIPFLDAPPLGPDRAEAFLPSAAAGETGTLYEHCRRALEHCLERGMGAHGLPLMGSGDWNDGMNRVGHEGKGESVWLGWFLYTNLMQFADVAEARGDAASATRWREHARQLQPALEGAWDGLWYRRAYFDDGSPLGSGQNAECKIDSIAQSWAVISGAAPLERTYIALDSVEKHLVREAASLILLLTPPFNQSQPDPGYIQGYVPGIRENGGQYTHAALWLAWAYVLQGNGDRAAELCRLLNPVQHALTPEAVERYKVEPYVIAADVYSHPQHLGRGGWTWYTGSASWMYRVGLEGILGLRRRGATLSIDPCLPQHWPSVELRFRYGSTRYTLTLENPKGVTKGITSIALDGQPLASPTIPLHDDKRGHHVRVVLG